MFRPKLDKERERFYLLPGMGGQEARRKHLRFLRWSAIAALGMSVILAALMYLLNRFVF
ncbi:MAG: hypothetical protein ABSH11_10370 [Verrucomicrobiota bacterium]|jgi:hypothetical protein